MVTFANTPIGLLQRVKEAKAEETREREKHGLDARVGWDERCKEFRRRY